MRPTPTAAHFGPGYYHGRIGSNYRHYERRQGQRLSWLPLLWMFRLVSRRYPGASVAHLDVGCALGHFLAYAAPAVSASAGVDLSPYAVARAQELFPALTFAEASAESLPFADGTFHIVSCFDTLEHTLVPGAALRELTRVLKAQGTLMLRMPYDGLCRACFGKNDRDPTHVSVLSLAGWRQLLEDGGLRIAWTFRYPTPRGGNVVFIVRKG